MRTKSNNIQMTKDMQESISINYAKMFIQTSGNCSFESWLNNNLSKAYYYNQIQLVEMIELTKKVLLHFGSQDQIEHFKNLNSI